VACDDVGVFQNSQHGRYHQITRSEALAVEVGFVADTRRDGHPITFAGLWDQWWNKQAGETISSCAMVVTQANEFVAEVHDRMPIILEADQFEPWLSGRAGLELLKPSANDVLQCWPVSKHSSRASDDDESLIEQISPPEKPNEPMPVML
jgi:putative SOS response-associated peptidase YedK